MKDQPILNPVSPVRLEHLLAFAYGEYTTTLSVWIEKEIDSDESLQVILKGIRKVRRIHGFESKEVHQKFLIEEKGKFMGNIPASMLEPSLSFFQLLEIQLKTAVKKVFALINIPFWLTTANLYRAMQCKPDLKLAEAPLPGGVASSTLIDFYQNDQYEKALQVLGPFGCSSGQTDSWGSTCVETEVREMYRFLTGFCHLQLNQTEKAIQYFTKITGAGVSKWSALAFWQLGLAYLRADHLDAALDAFQSFLRLKKIPHYSPKKLFKRTWSVMWRIRLRQLLRSFSRYINE